ncbi:TonB-dependent receptor plug domain-containing protein [Pseudochelatococcus lubricantis]|uniref:TonB-dependent receptor plug domain-containing protein n=1 Tax=Pseudochelatococcus lubricantis TaxID=1538102 RepID=UPI0035EC4E02
MFPPLRLSTAHALRVAFLFSVPPALAALAMQADPVHARQADAMMLDEITVTATAVPTPVAQVGSAVTVITEQEIARDQRRTLADALATVPGLNMVQTGGPGGQASVFLRGTNANHVKVLVDGVPVNDPSTPNGVFDFSHLATADVARIEVLRGPQSGLYGADALGGVISITTKAGKGPPKAALMLEGGSAGTFNQSASLSGGGERFDYFFSAAHLRTEATPVTPPELVPPGQRINDDFYDNWSFATRLGFAVTDNFRLSVVGRYSDALLKNTTDGGWPGAPNAARSEQRNQRFVTRAEGVWSLWDGRITNTFGIGYANEDRESTEPATAFGPGSVTEYLGERTIYDWRADVVVAPDHKLILGLQHERERFDDASLTASAGNSAGFIEWQGKIFDRLAFAANIRHDDNDDFGAHTTWRIAPTFTLPVLETRLKASVGTGFKAPTLSQRFMDSRPLYNFYGNPDLRPEESTGYDIGFEQPLAGERVLIGATYFHNDIDNLINTNTDFTSYENVGKATTRGVEAFAAVALTPAVDLRADYTFTLARDDVARQELLRRPRHKASFTARWQATEKLGLSATALYVGAWVDGNRDFSIPRLRTSGYATVNVAVDYKAADSTVLFARVDNLFDRRYENPVGFLRPGLGVYAGLRFTPP